MESEWEIIGYDTPQNDVSIPTMNIKNSYSQPTFADQYANAVMQVESNMNPNAVNKRSGAKGLGQFMDATGLEVSQKLGYPEYKPFDADQNKALTHSYLNQLYDQFQSPELALAAYNYGMGNVQKAIKRAGSRDINAIYPLLPKETQEYIPRVQGNLTQGQSNYGAPNTQESEWEIVPESKWEIVPQETIPQERPSYIPSQETDAPQPESSWVDTLNSYSQKILDKGEYVKNLGAQAVNSAGFNLVDNYANQFQKLPNVVQDFIGTLPMGGQLAKGLLSSEEMKTENLDKFSKENPKAAFASQLAGALAQPASLVSSLPRAAGSAAFYGFGDRIDDTSDAKELTAGALQDALLGSAGYGVAKGVGKGIEAYKGWKGTGDLSKAEKLLSGKLKQVPEDTLQKAKATLKETSQPVFLPEALQIEDFTNQANRIANAPETSDLVQALLKDRKATQPQRYNDLLDALSPTRDTFEAGSALQKRAQSVIDAEERAREEVAQEYFGKAYKRPPINDVVQDPKFNEVMNSKVVQPIIDRLKKFPKYQDLRDDDPRVVQKVLEEITAEIDGPNVGSLANDLGDLKSTIYNTLETANPDLIKARDTYRIDSEKIQALKDVGLGSFAEKGEFNVTDFGKKLLNPDTPIQKIKAVSKALGEDGDELILSAVRSELSSKIDQRVGGNGTSSIFNKEFIKERLTKIIGEDRADTIIKKIDDEILISDQSLNYKMSPVRNRNQGNEAADFVDKGRDFFAYYGRNPMRAVGDGLSVTLGRFTKPTTQTLQEEASTIFSNEEALSSLVNILAERNYKPSSVKEQALINALLTRGAQKTIPTMEIKNSYKNN